jgi:hypothetical protein
VAALRDGPAAALAQLITLPRQSELLVAGSTDWRGKGRNQAAKRYGVELDVGAGLGVAAGVAGATGAT